MGFRVKIRDLGFRVWGRAVELWVRGSLNDFRVAA